MGKVGQWRVELQEMPEYLEGYHGEPHPGLSGKALEAWKLGQQDRRDDETPRVGEP